MNITEMLIQMQRPISSPNGRQKHERNMETDTDIFNLDEEKMIILITGVSHTGKWRVILEYNVE